MENKEVATAKKITQELIGGWFLYGILFGIVYSIINALIITSIESLFLKTIIVIIIQGIISVLIWKCSTQSTFKKRTMSYNDVPTVMRNLIIFTIVICIISGLYNYYNINNTIDKSIDSDYQLQYTEKSLSRILDSEQMDKYNKQKEEAIAKVKSQVYIYFAITEISLTAVYLLVLRIEKKEILKYVE